MSLETSRELLITSPPPHTLSAEPDPRLVVVQLKAPGGSEITLAQRVLGPSDAIRLPVQDMDAAVLNPSDGRPVAYPGVVAYLTGYQVADESAEKPPLSQADPSLNALYADIQDQTILANRVFAIAQGARYEGAFGNGLEHDPSALAEPLPYIPQTVGDLRKLNKRLQKQSVVEGGIGFLTGDKNDYGATIIPEGEGGKLAGLTVNRDTQGIELFSLNEANRESIRIGELPVAGWQSVHPDGDIMLYGSDVFLAQPSHIFHRMVVQVCDPNDLALCEVNPNHIRQIQQLLGSKATQQLRSTDTMPNPTHTPAANSANTPMSQEAAAPLPVSADTEVPTLGIDESYDDNEPDLLLDPDDIRTWSVPVPPAEPAVTDRQSRWSLRQRGR